MQCNISGKSSELVVSVLSKTTLIDWILFASYMNIHKREECVDLKSLELRNDPYLVSFFIVFGVWCVQREDVSKSI